MAATNANADNYFSPSRWVVSTVAGQGTHTTITAATSAASSGDTIVLMDYVATEDVAMKTGVSYSAFTGASGEPTSTVTGKWTYSSAGTVSISNIKMTTNSDNILAVTGSAASIVNLNNCYINCSNNTGISYSSSSASAVIILNDCTGNLGTTGIGYHTMSSTGSLEYNYCTLNNTGVSTTASSNSAGVVYFDFSVATAAFSTSSTGLLAFAYSTFNLGAISNTTSITTAGTGTSNNLSYCTVTSGSASAISIGTGTQITMLNVYIDSTNTNAITGAGTCLFSGIVYFPGHTYLNNTTTQTGGTIQGLRAGNAPSAGYIGEQIRGYASNIASATATTTNITSIALTPGVWDISCIAEATYTGTFTALTAGISGTNNTFSLTVADAYAGSLTAASVTVAGSLVISVPSYRVTISANTTYYLNFLPTFSTGASAGYGRISATRVG